MDEWYSDLETLQVNDNEENQHSSTKHAKVGIVWTCESLIQCVCFGWFSHQEVNQTNKTTLKLNTIFG